MKFLGVRFRNTFAYGNSWKNIPFGDLVGINLISGDNGWGKSSLSKILKIGAYFEYDGIPVGEIANEINGNCEIIVDGFSRGHNWEIHSTYTTSRLTNVIVKKDGAIQDTGKIKDTIDYVYREILTVPYPIFSNLVNLSVSDFKSLLSLDAKSARAIRDKLLSIENINDVKAGLNKENKKIVDEVETLSIELDSLVKSIADLDTQIAEEESRFKMVIDGTIKTSQDSILSLRQELGVAERERLEIGARIVELEAYGKSLEKKALQEQQIIDEKTHSQLEKKALDVEGKLAKIKDTSDVLSKHKVHYEYLRINEEITKNTNEIARLESTKIGILPIEANITTTQNEILELTNKKAANDVLDTLATKSQECVDVLIEIGKKTPKFSVFSGREQKIQLVKRNMDVELSAMNVSVKSLEKEVALLQKGFCSECGTKFDDEAHKQKLADKTSLLVVENNNINNLKKKSEKATRILSVLLVMKNANNTENKKDMLMKVLGELKGSPVFNQYVNLTQISHKTMAEAKLALLAKKEEIKTTVELANNLKVLQENLKTTNEENREIDLAISSFRHAVEQAGKNKVAPEANLKIEYAEDTIPAAIEKATSLKSQGEEMLKKLTAEIRTISIDMGARRSMLTFLADVGDITTEMPNHKEALLECNDKHTQISKKISDVTQNVSSVEKEVQRLYSEHEGKLKSLSEFRVSQNTKKESLEKSIFDKTEEAKLKLYLEELLSEENFKRYCISSIIPSLNHSVKMISNEFNFPIKCEFDDDFQPKILRRGKPCSLKGISVGQRKILDIVVVLSVTSLIAAKYPEVNFVFYDEVFSNLSVMNTSMMLDQIKKTCCQKFGLSVFLVNHAFISQDYFDNIIELSNDGTFTDLTIRRLNIATA